MIHISSARFEGREREYVLDCIDRCWITQGVYVRKFEEAFANVCGTRHAIACSSGTAALHLALVALGVGPETTVTVPALTYVATANAVRYCAATVRFADVDRESWCMDSQAIGLDEFAIPVHLYDALSLVGGPNTVEDAAHAPGTHGSGGVVGSMGRIAAFSLYASKVVACGEGGMVTTNDDDLAEAVRLYRGQGADLSQGHYYHSVVGYNYRMTDLQAAVGLAQIERLDLVLEGRRRIVNRYRSNLAGSRIELQGGERASGWVMAVLLPADVRRDDVTELLKARGIETRPFFVPLPALPPYRSTVPPVTAEVAQRGLCLPTHLHLDLNDIDYVCEHLLGAVT